MKKILFIHTSAVMGGAEHSLLELLRHGNDSSLELHLAIPFQQEFYRHVYHLPVQCHDIAFPYPSKHRRFRYLGVALCCAVKLYRLATKEKISVVYCNTYCTLPFCLFVKLFSQIHIICHCRDNISSLWIKKLVRHMAGEAIAVSAGIFRQLPGGIRTCMIPNGIDLSHFVLGNTSGWLRRQHSLPEDVLSIGNIGQILPWKNQMDFLSVSEQLLQNNQKLHFFLVGVVMDEDYYLRLRQRIDAWNLGTYFTFTGQVDDTMPYLSGFSVVLHTATREPFGRVPVEAAALEKPVIAYSSGGTSETIEHDVTGYLVPDGDVRQMAELTAHLLKHPALRESMGKLARKRVAQLFDGRDYARRVYRLLASNATCSDVPSTPERVGRSHVASIIESHNLYPETND